MKNGRLPVLGVGCSVPELALPLVLMFGHGGAFAADEKRAEAEGKIGNGFVLPANARRRIEVRHTKALAVSPGGSLTVEAWCRAERVKWRETQYVYSRYGGSVTYGLGIYKEGHARFFMRDSKRHIADCRSAVVLSPKTWYHLAGVYDARAHRLRLFVNGQLVKELKYTPKGDFATAVPHYLGACGSLKRYHFVGAVDDVRISNCARDASALWGSGVYAKGLSTDESTVGLWTFEGDDPGTDASGNGHHGKAVALVNYSSLSLGEPQIDRLDSGLTPEVVERRPYVGYVRECIETLMEHGTDRYGKVHTPVLVTILDVVTRTCPEWPPHASAWRGHQRECFWKPRGADLLVDQSTLKTMFVLSRLTGDERHAAFAKRYLQYYLAHLVDSKGFIWWGWHRFYDVHADKMRGSHGNHHEIHANLPLWSEMWQIDPEATRREVEAIWKWHVVDKRTGEHNRHGNGGRGCDFAMSGGEFLYALAFLYTKTDDKTYLDGARLVADYHWNTRNPDTDLIATRPNVGKGRFDGWHFDTMVTGLLCYYLLKTYELTDEPLFRDQALAYLSAYSKYGYDPESKQFWAGLLLDGAPEPDRRGENGYKQRGPSGYCDIWEPYMLGHEHAVYTAQCYAYAYQLTGESFLLDTARKWADCIRRALPAGPCRPGTYYYDWYARHFSKYGTFAGMYGRTISFFLHLHAITREQQYLGLARQVARDAVSKLWYRALFRGHPGKRYYGAVDGVGFLLYALTQLHLTMDGGPGALAEEGIRLGAGAEVIGYDNW